MSCCSGFPLTSRGFSGAQRHRLAQEAGSADWALSSSTALLPADRYLRLWELVEHELRDPDVALRAAQAYTPGQLGLIDYLFLTAPTVAAGLAATGAYSHVTTTNLRFDAVQESDDEVTTDLSLLDGGGRGRAMAVQVRSADPRARPGIRPVLRSPTAGTNRPRRWIRSSWWPDRTGRHRSRPAGSPRRAGRTRAGRGTAS